MILLPKSFACLASLAAEYPQRYSMTCVRVTEKPEEGIDYRIEVTDGKRLAIVRGISSSHAPPPALPLDLPAQPSSCMGCVPQAAWKQAFKGGKNGAPLALHLCTNEVIMATGDTLVRVPLGTGKYPDVNAVMPKDEAPVSFRIDPYLLIDLLKCAAQVCGTTDVTISYYGDGMAIGITAKGENVTFDGILMPLS